MHGGEREKKPKRSQKQLAVESSEAKWSGMNSRIGVRYSNCSLFEDLLYAAILFLLKEFYRVISISLDK